MVDLATFQCRSCDAVYQFPDDGGVKECSDCHDTCRKASVVASGEAVVRSMLDGSESTVDVTVTEHDMQESEHGVVEDVAHVKAYQQADEDVVTLSVDVQ